MTDPYEAQGSNLRVHHPVQPKTQVEKWREEREANIRFLSENVGKYTAKDQAERWNKVHELEELIAKATQPIHPRYATGTFADDEEKCICHANEDNLKAPLDENCPYHFPKR